jgi:hypothetical protein
VFTSFRYMTRGIQDQVGLDLQIIMWSLIDSRLATGEEMDYLQVFNFTKECTNDTIIQNVIHKQEQPIYEYLHSYGNIANPLDITVWVIDDGSNTTMLLPSEY